MIKYIFLGLLIISTAVHLYHSYTLQQKKRAYTKPLLLIFILLFYLFGVPKAEYSYFLIFALLTSWLGDVLLIPKGNKWFTLGGIAFLFSHILFICVYIPNIVFSNVIWAAVIPAFCVYAAVVALIFRSLWKHVPKKMKIPMVLYLIMNGTMNTFALMQLTANPCAASLIAYIGAVMFFISDCTLFLVRFHPNKNLVFKQHFTVMLTYVAGEFMITLGMMMLK